MPQDQNNLIWVDMEMTGLFPDTDRIIEVAIVITDPMLTIRVEGPVDPATLRTILEQLGC